jgi:S-(hydroxymethyl)mycothiol dehydrogenase
LRQPVSCAQYRPRHEHHRDPVIDAVGRPETYRQAFYARDLAGTVVLVGVPTPQMTLELPLLDVFGRGGALKSSWYGDCLPSRDFPMLIDLYLDGRLELDAFVSETISMDAVEHAFARMHQRDVALAENSSVLVGASVRSLKHGSCG